MGEYTTKGSVRSDCGHRHRSLETAVACLSRDRRACQKVGGYSDRWITRLDGCELTEIEIYTIEHIFDQSGGSYR